jgi:hypothetical protein
MSPVFRGEIALITPRFGRIHTRVYEKKILTIPIPMCTQIEILFQWSKSKTSLCISHTQLAILIGIIVLGRK